MVNKLVFTGVGVAGFVAGFEVDRRNSNSPYRVDKRTPEIARRERPDGEETPRLEGEGRDSAALWFPILGSAVGLAGMATAARLVRSDRIWRETFAGRGAVGMAIAGATMAAGVLSSRAILG